MLDSCCIHRRFNGVGSKNGNEKANENYTTDFIYRLYCEEGKDVFTARQNILGHMQQGGTPSPFDRNFGTKTATRAFEWMVLQLKAAAKPDGTVHATTPETACLLGLIRRQYFFTPVQDLKSKTDWKHRIGKEEWWLSSVRDLLKIFAHHSVDYTTCTAVIKCLKTPDDGDNGDCT
ncbi:hypothetical protein HPB51_021128 [Rhipicephalus microplus]|uniref:Phosphofructokinase domain-containing protein n=1 Tax=Rhipicephalus microplus TaxID=6941 RepID=A0A9J6DWV6_RHIMP|nr:hypothetical protein HPB51_021128 [Rhipicephalus microplus]